MKRFEMGGEREDKVILQPQPKSALGPSLFSVSIWQLARRDKTGPALPALDRICPRTRQGTTHTHAQRRRAGGQA